MRRQRALAQALESALAPVPETLFLQACLPSGEPGRAAFQRWQELAGDPVRALRARSSWSRGLLGALFAAQAHNGAQPDPALASVLRAAYAHELLRADALQRVAARVLGELAHRGVNALATGGVALAEWFYRDWGARHCHDIDLLIDPGSHALAEQTLADLRAEDGAGVAVALHTRPYPDPFYGSGHALRHRSLEAQLAGAPIRALDPIDMLIHVCIRSLCCGARDGRWAIDAWVVLHRHADPDWDAVLDRAREGPFALGLQVRLSWLARELASPIPPSFLSALSRLATTKQARAQWALLHQARRDVGGRALIRSAPSLRARSMVARELALTSRRRRTD